MSETKHTPGPWIASNMPGDWGLRGAVFIMDGAGKQVAYVEYTTPYCMGERPSVRDEAVTAQADARLIAAAPEMGAMLLSMFSHVSHGGPTREEAEDLLRRAGLIEVERCRSAH